MRWICSCVGEDIDDAVAGGKFSVGKHWTTNRRYSDGMEGRLGVDCCRAGEGGRGGKPAVSLIFYLLLIFFWAELKCSLWPFRFNPTRGDLIKECLDMVFGCE